MSSPVCLCSPNPESTPLDGQTRRTLWLGLMLVGSYSVLEFAMGWCNHSLSLMADAAHMVSDSVAFGSSLLAFWLARRSTQQYQQAGTLAAFANGIGLLISALWIVWEAVSRFQSSDWALETTHSIVVTAMLGLFINGMIAALLHRPGQSDLNLKGVFWHVVTDLLSSISVLVAAGAMVWWHWWWMDTVVSLAVALVVLLGGLSLVWDSGRVLLGRSRLQTDGITPISLQSSTSNVNNSAIAHLPGAGWLGQSSLIDRV